MEKLHYFLVYGHVIFHTKDGEPGQIGLNAIVIGNSGMRFPVSMLGKAQQNLQFQFHKKVQDPSVTVVDVPIQNIVYLGHMTEKEFHAVPEGMAVQEKPPVTADNPFGDAAPSPTTVN